MGTEPVVALLAEEWRRVDDLCAPLSSDQWLAATTCPGWTVHDVLAHIIGTESALIGLPTPSVAPDALRASHVKNATGATNEAWVESMRDLSPSALVERFRATASTRRATLEAMSSSEFDALSSSPIGQVPYREFMDVRLMDCWVHEQDIREAIGRPGHQSGPIVERSVSRFASAMPFVVVRKAGAEDGSAVVFDLFGNAPLTITVVVSAGRGRLAPDAPSTPTVRLKMATATWWALALGRRDVRAARKEGLVEIVGDGALGERVIDSLAFMI